MPGDRASSGEELATLVDSAVESVADRRAGTVLGTDGDWLPDEVWAIVIGHLDLRAVLRANRVCCALRGMVSRLVAAGALDRFFAPWRLPTAAAIAAGRAPRDVCFRRFAAERRPVGPVDFVTSCSGLEIARQPHLAGLNRASPPHQYSMATPRRIAGSPELGELPQHGLQGPSNFAVAAKAELAFVMMRHPSAIAGRGSWAPAAVDLTSGEVVAATCGSGYCSPSEGMLDRKR